ncbi:fumarylacetoacetate hydrolase family protein [Actinomadura montaniterrae]|uniref:Fumarylacetoacetate hydrolase family protein n=1 Tax=Actinomadura montaniterrae TaxID=1803903 RepID=A0A6L3VYM9_9ACTN|nr:fumarylacetoacetate hydrolase family protein [Actinomadura montaniterrae]KAB2386327.1 fumarylacetoacetate hydrolase family protein [Actinomadura montaniterrae]
MRIANHAGRAVLVVSDGKGADIATASDGRFGPGPQSLYDQWDAFTTWAANAAPVPDVEIDAARLGSPSPAPSQVVAIGLNYADHAAETGFEPPTDLPPVFTKFASSITGPYGEIALPDGGHTDWEVEVVAVIGRTAHRVTADAAWDHVAGLSAGQDLSERILQFTGEAPQFGFAKSYPGFAPIGPWLVTLDELPDRDDLALGCAIDGETVQDGRTSKLIFSIPRTIAKLSEVITLRPGDVVFTGTPDGVGLGRTPQRFLHPGETLRTWVEGIGEMHHTFR